MKKSKYSKKLPKYDGGGMTNDEYNMSLYSPEDQAALNGSSNNIYNQKRGANISAGQYAAYGQAAGALGNQLMYNNQLEGEEREQANAQAFKGTANSTLGSSTGWGAAATGASNLGRSLIKRDESGNATSRVGRVMDTNMTATHEGAIDQFSKGNTWGGLGYLFGGGKLGSVVSQGLGKENETTGFWGKTNKLTGLDSKFAMGGMNMQPNAEVEKQENTIAPDGEFTQFDGPSHEQGGIPVNLDPGELIFSDKLKLGKKTFAQLNKANNTNKQDKILENPNADRISKKTAELLRMAKLKNSEMLFKQQEELKQTKLDNYKKRLGGIQEYPNGGITPQQYRQAQSDSTILYKSGLNPRMENFQYPGYNDAYLRLNDLNGTPPESTNNTVTFQGKEYTGATSQFTKPTMVPYNAQAFSKEQPYTAQQAVPTQTYHPRYNQAIDGIDKSRPKFWDGGRKKADPNDINALNARQQKDYQGWFNANSQDEGFNPDDYSVDNYMKQYESRGAVAPSTTPTSPTNSKNMDWGKIGTQVGLGLANNVGNFYDLARSNKTETTKYDRATANLLDPSAAMRDATEQTRRAERSVRDASGGNAANYLSNRVALSAQNVLNKDRIRQQYANANAGILNQNSMFNTQIQMRENDANEQNRAQTRNIKGQAMANIGSNAVSQYRDNKAQDYDETTLDNMSEFYTALKNDPYAKAKWEKIKKGYK